MILLAFLAWSCCCLNTRSLAMAWTMSDDLAGEVAGHLHIQATELLGGSNTWEEAFRIDRELQGAGFHRSLNVWITHLSEDASRLAGCQLSLVQPLPSSIFADPYQLEDLSRASSKSSITADGSGAAVPHAGVQSSPYTFQLFGPLDLELPAPACKATALLLSFNLTHHQQQPSLPAAAVLSVPLHAKYPEPQAFGLQGWHALLTGHVEVVVPWPSLLLDCRAAGGQLQVMQPPQQQQDQQQCVSETGHAAAGRSGSQQGKQQQLLLWSVPAGNLDHLQFVSWGTLLISAACCAALSLKAVQVMVMS